MKNSIIQKLVLALVPLLLLAITVVAQDYVLYTVQTGDTLSKIGANYCTTWSEVYEINKQAIGGDVNVLRVGTLLTVPDRCLAHSDNETAGSSGDSNAASPAPGVYDRGAREYATGIVEGNLYTVAWGDTIFSIAERFGLSRDDILYANEGTMNSGLRAGTRILIPGLSGLTTPNPGTSTGVASTLPTAADGVYDRGPIDYARGTVNANRRYTVAAGDTLFSIGLRFGVTRDQLLDSNESVLNFGLRAGTIIIIPGLTTDVQNPFGTSADVQAIPEPPAEPITELSAQRIAELDNIVPHANIPEIQREMDAGRLTSVELTLYFLDRIQRYESLNTMISINPNAVSEAFNADVLRSQGTILGPLHGIPVNLKDNIETAGLLTTGGSIILQDYVPDEDAPLVAQLREGGAVILGKANLSEFAGGPGALPGFSALGGQTINPYGPDFSPAGSSSGSGASTGAVLTMVSVGTETSGSLIAPAAFAGTVGMKPSRDVVSTDGVIPLISYQDSPGPIARNVTDAALLLGIISTQEVDYALGLVPEALNGVPVGILAQDILEQPPGLEDVSDNAEMLQRIETGLQVANANVIAINLDNVNIEGGPPGGVGPADILPQLGSVIVMSLIEDVAPYIASTGAPITSAAEWAAFNQADPDVRMPQGQPLLDAAATIPTDEELGYEETALTLRDVTTQMLNQAFEDNGVDVIVSITNRHSDIYATAGFPAVTVPLGLRQNGMPTGVTFIGKQGEDAKVLAYAYAFEQATQYRVDPPLE